MKKTLGLLRELFFRSKLEGVASELGGEIVYAASIDQIAGKCAAAPPEVVFVDLSDKNFPAGEVIAAIRAAAPGAGIVGFASHVDLEAIKAARDAGFDRVLSRQEFAARLPALLK
jgi:DNA-binding NarL/FixJ family response regulator